MAAAFVVGGGPSLTGFQFSRLNGVDSIATNAAILNCKAKYFITIDYTFLKKIRQHTQAFQTHKASKFFVANLASGNLTEARGGFICSKLKRGYDLSKFDVVIKSRRCDGLSFQWKGFRSGNNSGFCALQLAVLLGYSEIYLLGIDLTYSGKMHTHYHNIYGGRPARFDSRLAAYYNYFETGICDLKESGIKVYSCSEISLLNRHIPYIPIDKVL